MSKILRIDASSRVDASSSRLVGDYLEMRLLTAMHQPSVVRRDVGVKGPGHITNATIEAMFGVGKKRLFGGEAATKTSDAVIAEVREAEVIIITTPMYNFGVPSALKAWIDQLVRVGQTFAYENGEFRGLLASKPVYVIVAYGAPGYADGPLRSADFVRPYLEFVLRFIGLTYIKFIGIEGTSGGTVPAASAQAHAKAAIDALVAPNMRAAA